MPDQNPPVTPPKASPLAGRGSFNLGFIPAGNPQSQYDKGTLLAERSDLNAARSRNQPWYDELGNMGLQILSTVVGQTIETAGSVVDGIHNILAENDFAPDEGLTGAGQDIVNWGANEHPIYWDKNQKGLINGSYIASRIPSVASTLSMLLPGMAAGRIGGGIARALKLGSNIEKVMAIGAGGITMRHAENWMESAQVYSNVMDQYIQGINLSGDNEEGKKLKVEEADKIAKAASTLNYQSNWTNLAFDLLQMGMVLKPVSGLFSKAFGSNKLTSVLDYGYGTTKARGLLGAVEGSIPQVGKLQSGLLRGIDVIKPFAAQATEGIEEVVNQVSQYEAQRQADIQAGTLEDDNSSLVDRIKNKYLGDWETKDAFIWGLVGGVAFQMGGSAVQAAQHKNGYWNNVTEQTEKIASIKHRQEQIQEYSKIVNDEKATKYDKEVARHNLIFNLAQSNRQSDTLDLLVQDLNNPKLIGQLATNMGISQEEMTKQIPSLIEDIKWIDNAISEYEGGNWNSMIGRQSKDKTNMALDISERDMEGFKNQDRRMGNFADPKLAMQLAYNDYSMKVRDRINEEAVKDIAQTSRDLYGSENLSPNAQTYLNLDSDIIALNAARFNFQSKLDQAIKLDLSKPLIDEHKSVVDRITKLIEEKTKNKEDVLKSINENLKDQTITTETPLEKIKEMQEMVLPVSKIISKKATYFINQAEKRGIMDTNKRILKDPKAFEVEAIEDMRKISKTNEAAKAETAAQQEENKKVSEAVDALYTTPEFDKFYKDAVESLNQGLDKRQDESLKNEYLQSELEHVNNAIKKATADGLFDSTSIANFQTKFDKNLFMTLRAREKAILEHMPKKTALKPAAASQKKSTQKTNYKSFEEGTPPKEYHEFKTDNYYFRNLITDDSNNAFPLITIEQDLPIAQEQLKKLVDLQDKLAKATSDTERDAINKMALPILQDVNIEIATDVKGNKVPGSIDETVKMLELFITNSTVIVESMDLPLSTNPVLLQNLPFNRTNVGMGSNQQSGLSTRLFTKYFFREIPLKYNTLRSMLANIDNVSEILNAEESRLKEIADLFLSGKEYNSKPENISSDPGKIERALDTDQGVESKRTANRGRESVRSKFPGSNESYSQKVAPMLFEDRNGVPIFKRDNLGRMMPNGGYPFWSAHDLPNGKPGKGYVQSGDTVVLKYNNTAFGPEIQLFKDDIHIGNLDSSDRLKKSLLTAESKLAALTNEATNIAERNELKNSIARYQELIPKIQNIESQMQKAAGPMEIKVKDRISDSDDSQTSGGIFIGDMMMTEVYDKNGKKWTNPISILDAFGENVNLQGEAILTIFYDGTFYIKHDGQMADVTNKFSDITIPDSQRRKYTGTVDKNVNSTVFALLPTHTLTKDGKHIYMPVRIYTLNLNDSRISQDGRQGGPTLPEVMLNTMMNPDKNTTAFTSMVEFLGLKSLYQEGKLMSDQSKRFIDAFYTTENLIRIFNSVTYVYDGSKVSKDPTKNADYSKHIGIDVFYPKNSEISAERLKELDEKAATTGLTEDEAREGKRYPIIRFDLSNDAGVKNTYAIRLLDADGKFNPVFGKVNRKMGQLLDRNSREEVTKEGLPLAYQTVTVDVLDEINKRFNQKIFRVDKELIGNSTNDGRYTGFSFDDKGMLQVKQYKSYIHYLSEHKFIESTVHGMEVRTADRKSSARNYFYNRSIWFEDNISAPSASKKEIKKVVKKGKAKTASTKKVPGQNSISIVIPDAIIESIAMKRKGNIKLSADGKKYIINGKEYDRVSNVIGSTFTQSSKSDTVATAAGNTIDAFSKDFFDQKLQPADVYNLSNEDYQALIKYFRKIQLGFVNGETIVGTGVVLYGTSVSGQNIAGEVDLLTIDLDGNFRIYDFKSSTDVFTERSYNKPVTGNGITRSKREQHHMQLSSYSKLLEGMTGSTAADMVILPITLSYTESGGKVNMDSVNPYKPIHFGSELSDNNAFEIAKSENKQQNSGVEQNTKNINDEYYEPALLVKKLNPTGANETLEGEDLEWADNSIEKKIKSGIKNGLDVPTIMKMISAQGYIFNYGSEIETLRNYVKHRLEGKTNVPFSEFRKDTRKSDSAKKSESKNNQSTNEDLYRDDDDEVGFGTILPEGSHMASVVPLSDDDINNINQTANEKNVKLIYRDPGRLRAYGHSMGFQNSATDFVGDLITKVLYEHRVVNNDLSALTMQEIKDRVKDQMEKTISKNAKLIANGRYINKAGNIVSLSENEINTISQQSDEIEKVNRYLDYVDMTEIDRETSHDFVGYIRLGLMNLNSSKLVSITLSNGDDTEVISEDDEINYSTRFAENYSVKIDPRTTVTIDAKILLSQMRELERVTNPDGSYSFNQIFNRFGTPKNYNLNGVLNELHIEFEDVAHERFLENLNIIEQKSPYVKSLFQTIDRLSKGDKDKKAHFFDKLSSVIKQHRKMLFATIDLPTTEDDSNVTVTFSDAARQGITENIITNWQNRFKDNFETLFDVKEIEDAETDEKSFNAIPKKQDSIFETPGSGHIPFEFKLPEDFDTTSYPFTRSYKLLFDQLQDAISKYKKISLKFDFDKQSNLIVGKTKTNLTAEDVLHIASLFNLGESVVFNKSMANEIELNKSVFADTYLNQIVKNLQFLLKRKGSITGDENTRKNFNSYDPIIYQMMATQLQRIGIQLSENEKDSYLVLADLNSKADAAGRFMKFQRYDRDTKDFASFLINKIDTLIIKPITTPGAFYLSKDYVTSDDASVSKEARLNIDEPLARARIGLTPFALHARTEWVTYSNEIIRNANGDLEYTYNPHNTLSIWMNKLKDKNTGFLDQLAQTPMGKFNRWIQSLNVPDSQALSSFDMKYIDGGKINRFKTVTPENVTLGIDSLIGWNAYMNGESRKSGRNMGYYITTHGDSTNMPAFQFNKDVIDMVFTEKVGEDGTVDYDISVPEQNENGQINPVYDRLYGIFRGELERIAQGYRIYNEIMSIEDLEERKNYAFKNYILDTHFKTAVVDGKTIIKGPGNSVNLYFMGSSFFNNPKATGLFNQDRSGLSFDLVDGSGYVNEEIAKDKFSKVVDLMLNEMIDDAYQGVLQQENDFFEITRKFQFDEESSKSYRLDIKFPYLNSKSVQHYRSELFARHVTVIKDGEKISTAALNDYVERPYSATWLKDEKNIPLMYQTVHGDQAFAKAIGDGTIDGLTKPEVEQLKASFTKIKDAIRSEDYKTARRPYALLKYMVADRIINEYVFRSSLYQAIFDPAIISKSKTYQDFHYDFSKRNTSLLAPGDVMLFDPLKDAARVVGFKDHNLGDVYKTYSQVELNNMDVSERNFLDEFKKKLPQFVKDGKIPIRAIEYSAFYYSLPEVERESLWPVIKEKLAGTKTTDAGSYITAREYLFREVKTGRISNSEYQEGIEAFYYNMPMSDTLKKKLQIGVKKYVYAGPNIVTHDDDSSSLMGYYIKNAELPLIKGITTFAGTPLDNIREQLEQIENREYRGYSYTKPHGGIIAVPPSAFKLGFSSEASLYDEDGNSTQDLMVAPVLSLDRTFLRQQIESSKADKDRATVSIQSAKFKALNIPSNWRFGRSGSLTFSMGKEKSDIASISESVELNGIDEDNTAANGLTSNQIEIATYRIYRQLAIDKIHQLSNKMGFQFDETSLDYKITDIDKFIGNITQHALDQYGVSSNATAYLETVPGENRMRFPISFSPNNMRFQSIIVAELQKVFHRFSLPGGAYATISATGITKDNTLRSYRLRTERKTFANQEAVNQSLNDEEISTKTLNADGTITVDYFVVDPGEAIMVWNFKDSNGKLLPYKQFVNEDGTIKTIEVNGKQVSIIDEDLLEIIVNRIPNTGANTMSRLRTARFFPEDVKDAIAMAPEIVDVYNADHDFDKLFTYVYNHEIVDGRLMKQKSVLHYTQNGITDFLSSDNARRAFARNELLASNSEYAKLIQETEDEEDTITSQDAIENNNPNFRNWSNVTAGLKNDFADKINKIKEIENTFLGTEDFKNKYDQGSIYSRQTPKQLENALLDSYHIMLGDFKTMRQSTLFLNADWLHNQLERKFSVPVSENGESKMVTKTLESLFEESNYYNIASFWTSSKTRASNSEAARMVGIAANMQTSMYLAQRYGLSYNSLWGSWSDSKQNKDRFEKYSQMTDYELEDAGINRGDIVNPELNPGWKYFIVFKDNEGVIKKEKNDTYNSFNQDNMPYRHNGDIKDGYTAFHKNSNIGQVYGYPSTGRYRYDRIYTIDNKGNRVNTSTPIQSVLQAFLDNKNNPVRGYLNMNSKTSNAFMNMIMLGYVDEAPLVLLQESVKRYIDKINQSTSVNAQDSVAYTKNQIKTISEILEVDESTIWEKWKKLEKGKTQNIYFLLGDLISDIKTTTGELEIADLSLSENELSAMIPMQMGYVPKSADYKYNQLKALRTFLLADNYGRGVFNVQQATSADSKGLSNSFVGLDIQRRSFLNLFKIDKENNRLLSSAPTVAGLHRITPYWAKEIKKSPYGSNREHASWLPSMPAFTYSYGIKPAYDLLSSVGESNVFYEFSTLFKTMQNEFSNVVGSNIYKLNPTEQARIMKKLNVNFVSYIMSSPTLYRNFFGEDGDAEYEFFKEFGKRALSLPDTSLPISEDFAVFNNLQSLAATLKNVANFDSVDEMTKQKLPYRNQYEILNALMPIASTNGKTPTATILPGAARFQEGLADKLHVSLAAMFESGNDMLIQTAKKIVLYAYMAGGVTTPTSFVQHIPPYILTHFNVDKILYNTLQQLTDYTTLKSGAKKLNSYGAGIVQTFMVQYLQHNRFEMKNNVDAKSLEIFPADPTKKNSEPSLIGYNKDLGRMVIKFKKESKPPKGTYLVKFSDRLFIKVPNKDGVLFKEIDYAGYSRYHRNEYEMNSNGVPVNSLYYRNQSEKSASPITGDVEINYEIEEYVEDEEDKALRDFQKRVETPFVKKLASYIKSGFVNLDDFLIDLRMNQESTIPGAVFTLMEMIATNTGGNVVFRNEPDSNWRQQIDYNTNDIYVNYGHKAYGDIANMDTTLFVEDMAHEVAHLGTARAILKAMSDRKSADKNFPGLGESVDKLVRLKSLVEKFLTNGKTEDSKNFIKYASLIKDIDAGKDLSKADIMFIENHSYFRALIDTKKNKEGYGSNAEIGLMLEFASYSFSNGKFQEVLNRISFKDDTKNKTLWEKLKEVLSEIMEFFGFGTSENANNEIISIQKKMTGSSKYVEFDDNGFPESKKTKKGELSKTIAEIKAYSGLHVALKNLIDIRNTTSSMSLDRLNEIGAISNMTSVYTENKISLDSIYDGVKNYDKSWPDDLKELYHQAASSGSIIC